MASRPFLISRMSFTSSTSPFSQLLPTISRLMPWSIGIFDFFHDSSESAIFTSMNVREACHDLFRFPALALEIDDIRLHEDRAAIPEHRHCLGAERQVRVFLHVMPETHAR